MSNRSEYKKSEIEPSQVQMVVFDMDGTLYKLDGENGEFGGSSLQKTVLVNAARWFAENEGVGESEAEAMITTWMKNGERLSEVFAEKYGISRVEYFNRVWDIDPQGLVNGFETAKDLLQQLGDRGVRMTLVTASPRIWQERVLKYLGISELFEKVWCAEQYSKKGEVYAELIEGLDPGAVLAVGDQYESDICPAEELGMLTWWLEKEDDINELLVRLQQ